MIRDYSKYDLSAKEKTVFYSVGYTVLFLFSFLFYRSLIISAATGLFVLKIRPYYETYLADRRLSVLQAEFKDLLYSLSASVSSGRQMSEALIEAEENLALTLPPDSCLLKELHYMCLSIRDNNESDSVLLADFAGRSHCEDIRSFVQVYTTCRNLGGDLEKVISRSCDMITDKMNIKREIEAITSQKKLEGRLIALMPPVMLALMNLVSSSYIEPLYTTIGGRIIMTVALAATAVGAVMMERISNVEI